MTKYMDSSGIAEHFLKAYEIAPYPDTALAILDVISHWMGWLDEKVSSQIVVTQDIEEAMILWQRERKSFLQRVNEYYAAAEGAETQEDLNRYVIGPLFEGRYPEDMELEDRPGWPDAETPWRLTNDLIAIGERLQPFGEFFYEDVKIGLSSSIDVAGYSLSESKSEGGFSKDVEDALDSAGEYLEGLKKDIDRFMSKEIEKATAKKIQPWLVLGVGAVALLAYSRTRRQ